MKKTLICVVLVIALGVLESCAQIVSGEVVKSDKSRVTTPTVNAADMAALVDGNTAFGFDLFHILSKTGDTIFYSPYSISAALAMTYAGAKNDSEKHMADTLHFTLSQNRLHATFNWLDGELAKRGQGAKGKDDKGFRLHVVNAIWGQKGYSFLPSFLDVLAENYGAGLRILDFIRETEKSRTTINTWVSEQTEDRIKGLIPAGGIDGYTRLVLTNAIYFNAAWLHQFNENATTDAPFHPINGNDIVVPMMKQTESFGYAEGNGYQAVELPYDGRELSMVVMLPRSGQFTAFQEAIDATKVKEIIGAMKNRQVLLTMPRFQFDSEFSLKKALSIMGMGTEFTEGADFSGMTGDRDLFIGDVIHKAFVAVDEKGTEAAAATAVIMQATAMPLQPIEVTMDRPFIFLIRDIKTGAILFIGQVLSPVS